jgi:hypothetical protein
MRKKKKRRRKREKKKKKKKRNGCFTKGKGASELFLHFFHKNPKKFEPYFNFF